MIIDHFDIENKLNNYKKNKAYIETTELRIRYWEETLNSTNDELLELFFDTTENIDLGMPRVKYKISSPVEQAFIKKQVKRDEIKEWIRNDKSRIFLLKMELEQIESSFKALSKEEYYVLDTKYFERWSWNNIETGFNEKFRTRNYIGTSGIKKIKRQAIDVLCELLQNFYNSIGK